MVKSTRTHSMGAEKAGVKVEATRTSIAMKLKDACVA